MTDVFTDWMFAANKDRKKFQILFDLPFNLIWKLQSKKATSLSLAGTLVIFYHTLGTLLCTGLYMTAQTCFGNLILWVNFIKDITGTSFEKFWHVISLHKDCNFFRVLNLNLESEELQCTLSCAPVGICFVNYLLQFSCTIKKFNSIGTRGEITVLVY